MKRRSFFAILLAPFLKRFFPRHTPPTPIRLTLESAVQGGGNPALCVENLRAAMAQLSLNGTFAVTPNCLIVPPQLHALAVKITGPIKFT